MAEIVFTLSTSWQSRYPERGNMNVTVWEETSGWHPEWALDGRYVAEWIYDEIERSLGPDV